MVSIGLRACRFDVQAHILICLKACGLAAKGEWGNDTRILGYDHQHIEVRLARYSIQTLVADEDRLEAIRIQPCQAGPGLRTNFQGLHDA